MTTIQAYGNIARTQQLCYGNPKPLANTTSYTQTKEKKDNTNLYLMVGVILLTSLGLAFRKQIKNIFKTVTQKNEHNITKTKSGTVKNPTAGNANINTKKINEMTLQELTLQKEHANANEKLNILKEIMYKSKGQERIKAAEEYIQYLDDIKSGKIKLDESDLSIQILKQNNFSNIEFKKSYAYATMSDAYKEEKNYDKALEMMNKALEHDSFNFSIVGEISKIQALKGNIKEGIKFAKKHLEEIKNEAFNDEQVFLFDGIAECIKYKGNTDLYKTINLLKKGSYRFNELTQEEIKFLTDRNIDYKTICGNGGREQTGAMAKWILEQIK